MKKSCITSGPDVCILTYMSRKIVFKTYLSPKNAEFLNIFILIAFIISRSAELSMENVL